MAGAGFVEISVQVKDFLFYFPVPLLKGIKNCFRRCKVLCILIHWITMFLPPPPVKHPVLLTEAPLNPLANKIKAAEVRNHIHSSTSR